MKAPSHKGESLVDAFIAFLHQKKHRCTAERIAIVGVVSRMKGRFEVDQLYSLLDSGGFHVSKATLYSNLRLLEEAGIVSSRVFDAKVTCYELKSADSLQQIHLICTKCGKVKDARDPEIYAMLANRQQKSFEVASYTVNAYGICSACARRRRKRRPKDEQK